MTQVSRLTRLLANLPPALSRDPLPAAMLSVQCSVTATWAIADGVLTTSVASGSALRYVLSGYTIASLATAIDAVSGYDATAIGGVGTLSASVLLDSVAVQTAGSAILLSGYTAPNYIVLGPVAQALGAYDDSFKAAVIELDSLHADSTWLDYWGLFAGMARYAGEADAVYADRIRSAFIKPKENGFALVNLLKNSPMVATAVIADAIVDDFSRADDPSTLGNTDTGIPWSIGWGVWGVLGGKGYVAMASGGKAGFAADQFGSNMFGSTAGTADAIIGAQATLSGGYSGSAVAATFSTVSNGMRLLFRQTTPGNEWYVEAQGTQWALVKNNANSASNSATYVASPVNGDVVLVTLAGSLITVFINGTQRMQVTDAFNATATNFGMAISDATAANARYDHFVVGTPGTFVAVVTMAGGATAQDQLNAQAIVNKYKAAGILATFQFL